MRMSRSTRETESLASSLRAGGGGGGGSPALQLTPQPLDFNTSSGGV